MGAAVLSTKALSLLAHIREGKVESTKAIVMQGFLHYPTAGRTRRDVQERCGLTSGSACARINELEKAGLIEKHTVVFDPVTAKRVNSYVVTKEAKLCQS